MSARTRRSLGTLSFLLLALTAGAVVTQVRMQPPAQPGVVTCSYVWAEYINNALVVSCSPRGGGSPMVFNVNRTDSPNIEEVLAFIQPFILTYQLATVLPHVSGPSPVEGFHSRIAIGHQGGEINRLRIVTLN